MTAILDRIPVERITKEAKEIHFGRTVLTVIAAVFFGVGWLVAKAFTVVWRAVTWCAVAVKLGWMEARKAGERSSGAS